MQLDRHPVWQALLHLRPHPVSRRLRSLADDAEFFLSATPHNAAAGMAQAELRATLAAFFDDNPRFKAGQTAQCRFRARYEWLREQLQFDPARLPPQPCARYDEWRLGIAADRVTLVYAAAYINSPASMFGHTLLRIDPPASAAGSPLLAYSINYAVATQAAASDWLFELKGLLGFYPGEFTNAPYYLRVREYSHLEDRDLWEYELALDRAELERLLAHTWELGFTRFDYWFFDENCSYHLLSLLDVARPGLNLTAGFTWRAIPSDTVKAVIGVPGLVRSRTYRPSATSQLDARAAGLDARALSQVRELVDGDRSVPEPAALAAASVAEQAQAARVLEAAERRLSIQAARGRLANAPAQQRRMALLGARATLPTLDEVTMPEPSTAPEAGHGSLRLELLAAGRRADGTAARRADGAAGGAATPRRALLNLSPAYHELLDPDPGFARGAQIRLFNAGLAVSAQGAARLDHLQAVDVLSVMPQTALRDDWSWKVGFGWRREFAAAPEAAPLVFGLNGGPGLAWPIGRGLMYALLDNQLWWSWAGGGQALRLGSGAHLGWVHDLAPVWRMHLELRHRVFLESRPAESAWRWRHRLALSPALNLVAHCGEERRAGAPRVRECALGLQHYR